MDEQYVTIFFPCFADALLEAHQNIDGSRILARDGRQRLQQSIPLGIVRRDGIPSGRAGHIPIDIEGVLAVGAKIGGVDAQYHQLIGHIGSAVSLEGATAGALFRRNVCALYLLIQPFIIVVFWGGGRVLPLLIRR